MSGDGLVEFARLVQRIHAGGGVKHQQDFMRRAGQFLVHDAMQLLQFLHEIVLGVEAAGGVDEQVIGFAGLRGGDSVVRDGGGIGAVSAGDHRHVQALAPEFELLDGRGAKRVARGQQRMTRRGRCAQCASLAEVVVLPVPLTPTMETTVTPAGTFDQSAIRGRKGFLDLSHCDFENLSAAAPLRFVGFFHCGDDLHRSSGMPRSAASNAASSSSSVAPVSFGESVTMRLISWTRFVVGLFADPP